jgi:hypothetical protein
MHADIKESDWKQFKEIHPIAMKRYDHKSIEEVQYHLTDKAKSETDRFFEIRDAVRVRDKERANLFDDYRRSTAEMQIFLMRRKKLITDEEMLRFSEELRDSVANMLEILGN